MPEAVIVATARSPIGRAFKGSLTTIRPDELARQMIAAALAKVPELDPAHITDLMLGCGLPGGEQGFNMARVVATLLGYDHLPGTTVTRYCASSLQTTRMAYHAIKAGEGDVFLSAGSRAGTLSSAARTICAVRSSGRMDVRVPLKARPIGERAVATMTASGMGASPRVSWGYPQPA